MTTTIRKQHLAGGARTMRRLVFGGALMAALIFGGVAGAVVAGFDDVEEGRFYSDAVAWAKENDITTGTSATTFEPDAAVTRGQMVTFLKRFYDELVATPPPLGTPIANGCEISGLNAMGFWDLTLSFSNDSGATADADLTVAIRDAGGVRVFTGTLTFPMVLPGESITITNGTEADGPGSNLRVRCASARMTLSKSPEKSTC